MSTQVLSPFPFFTDRAGSALNQGYVYIGVANQDPELFPQAVYWDEALTIPAAQPLRTANGYITNAGSPAAFFTDGAYSFRSRSRMGTEVGPQAFYRAHISDSNDALIEALASSAGAGMVGYDEDRSYPVNTVGHALRYNFALTPADFAEELPGGIMGVDDTAAFVALANAYYTTGRAVHIPDLGFPYMINADAVNFTPPASYNAEDRRPPAITADPSAVVKALTSGAWLIKLGTLADDYTGFLQNAEYSLPLLHDGGKTFTKAVLYAPFFLDMVINYRIICTTATRGAWFGDTAAPRAAAGVKGRRDYEWDFHSYARLVQSITNGANPTVTFAAPHGLWPSSGNRVACLNFIGTTPGVNWGNIHNNGVDCTILSSTQIQLKNVDSTTWGAAPTSYAYLNWPSSRVPKQIAGVTNANPAVITTTTPHLLTSGDIVDVAEIFGMPTLIGQWSATVLTSTTFSIPVNTTSTATWGAWTGFGPGWVMQWVPHAQCDIAEYHDNATDIDDSQFYCRHFRIGQYHNPAFCGWDGKKNGGHFYNFPEAGEQLCSYYLGGDNNFVQVQSDGPFRYVFWSFGPGNSSTQCSTNVYIQARDFYGALVRTESGAGWASYADRLKSSSASTRLLTEHVGLGGFACRDTITYNVAAPMVEFGSRNLAATVRFSGATGAVSQQFQTVTVTRTGAGVYVIDFARPVPFNCIMTTGGSVNGTAHMTVNEDEGYGSRSLTKRQITCEIGAALADPTSVSVEWRYP